MVKTTLVELKKLQESSHHICSGSENMMSVDNNYVKISCAHLVPMQTNIWNLPSLPMLSEAALIQEQT